MMIAARFALRGARARRGHEWNVMAEEQPDDQSQIIDFLSRPQSYPHRPGTVERIDTHGAIIFLAGDRAYKLKRAVKLAYLDFSGLGKRRAVCERELVLNSRTAPALYLGVLPVVREPGGGLRIGGDGEVADWLIEMRRFDQAQLFDRLAGAGKLSADLIEKLARAISAFHAAAPRATDAAWPQSLAQVTKTVTDALGHPELADLGLAETREALSAAITNGHALLTARRDAGFVRRCHGDLHLKNIVLLDGEPCLFDALEFDENLATVDVLYDLAFLIMDLWHRGLQAEANAILNHYFRREVSEFEWAGLALLPLFLALRAGVRAMVGLDGLAIARGAKRERLLDEVKSYALLAKTLIAPSRPRLLAIAGLSGTGKTTVARALAPRIAPVPGAVHLRSDVERKMVFGVAPTDRLGPEGYAPIVNETIYKRLFSKADAVLRAGHSVIIDATFLQPDCRDALFALARETGVPLRAIWLEADSGQMIRRVGERRNDASDADAAIVREQLARMTGAPPGWLAADARGDAATTTARVAALLGL